jgi:hypothetical protein
MILQLCLNFVKQLQMKVNTKIYHIVLQETKKLECDRYKIVVDVNVGEFKGQGIKVASRGVIDTTTDTYASSNFKNVLMFNIQATIFAVAMIFACYYE